MSEQTTTLPHATPKPAMDEKMQLPASPASELPSSIIAAHQSVPLKLLPQPLKAYGETVRLHRPAGIYAFFYPCVYGILLASIIRPDTPSIISVLHTAVNFFIVSFLARCLLVTWNDWHEYDFDGEVVRTPFRPVVRSALTSKDGYGLTWAFRPLARGALSTRDAFGLMAVLSWACWTAFDTLLPGVSWRYIFPVAAMHLFYPYAMRIMHHAELVLALALAGGSVLAFPALGVELTGMQDLLQARSAPLAQPEGRATLAVALLLLATIAWTLLCDTIHTAQDVDDDTTAGVRSTLLQHQRYSRWLLRALTATQVGALVSLGCAIRADFADKGALFFGLSCGAAAVALLVMVEKVDLRRPESAAWWLGRGNVAVAAAMVGGFAAEYVVKVKVL